MTDGDKKREHRHISDLPLADDTEPEVYKKREAVARPDKNCRFCNGTGRVTRLDGETRIRETCHCVRVPGSRLPAPPKVQKRRFRASVQRRWGGK